MTGTAVVTVGREETALEPYQLIALDRPQLEAAHAKMIQFVDARLLSVALERDEEKDALAIAAKNKWSVTKHRANVKKLENRVAFFEKVKAALEAGYVILPNFELEVFAIRTDAITPRGGVTRGSYNRFFQAAKFLQAGAGRYVSPNPTIITEKETERNSKNEVVEFNQQWPNDFQDVDFPVVMAKPVLMNAAGEAMAKRIFDELGVAVDSRHSGRRNGDPVLIGRIRNPGRGPDVSFYLGWYFDPTAL